MRRDREVPRGAWLVGLMVAAALVGVLPAQAAFPGRNGTIAFVTNRDGSREIYTMNPDGSEQTRLTFAGGFGPEDPEWSPDGSDLVFHRCPHNACDIYAIFSRDDDESDPDPELGSRMRRLTQRGAAAYASASWSPDGTKIVFGRQESGSLSQIYVMNADGTGARPLTDASAHHGTPAWSPDGTRIAFARSPDPRNPAAYDIFVMNADGSGMTQLTSHPLFDGGPEWSPDGSMIAFNSHPETGRVEIYVMRPDGSDRTLLTAGPDNDRNPAWSPDGSQIAFESDGGGNFQETEVFVMNADGSGRQALTAAANSSGEPTWQPLLPPPEAGRTVNVRTRRGTVLVSVPDPSAPGGRAPFVPLTQATQIPVGSIVDARKGEVRLTSAADLASGTQTGDFAKGRFQIAQTRVAQPITDLILRGGSFRRCPRDLRRRARPAASRVIRRLRGRARGRFRTRGRHSSAVVRGTDWTVSDRCNGTLTRVEEGVVLVRDFARRRNIRLRAGRSYLARPRRR